MSPSRANWLDPCRLVLASLAAIFVLYVANAWSPSHYAAAAALLGISDIHPLVGVARWIRTDEWAVTTPYFQIAVANHLGPIDLGSPYHEHLKAFFALPSRDWSMWFKPDLWGFLLLPPANAYSFHYAALSAAMVAGFAILLRQLGCSSAVALAGAATLFLSQFVQCWWTSNAPVFAWAPWPVVIWLWRAPFAVRAPLIAYATATWLIGLLYPPFIIASAGAFGILIVAFRPQALSIKTVLLGAVGAGAGVAVAWLHYADLIPVMDQTVYPGHRVSDGGGVGGLQLLAHVIPSVATFGFEPLVAGKSNACEIAVVGSVLPAALIAFADHSALRTWFNTHRRAVLVWAFGLLALATWCLLPVQGHNVPLLNRVPGYRMLWGLGLAWLLGMFVIANAAVWKMSLGRLAAFCALMTAGALASKLVISHAHKLTWFDLAPAAVIVEAYALARLIPPLRPPQRIVLVSTVACAAVTFAVFNPVQSARPIFAPADSALLRTARAYAAANPRHVAVFPEWYGATLNGVGVPAVNHVLLRPDLTLFHRAYPGLSPQRFNLVFNRYAHINPSLDREPEVLRDDGIAVPIDPFAMPLRVQVSLSDPPPVSWRDFGATSLGAGLWYVTLAGDGPWTGAAATANVVVSSSNPAVRIIHAEGARLPSPNLATTDPRKFAATFLLRLMVEMPPDQRPTPADFAAAAS